MSNPDATNCADHHHIGAGGQHAVVIRASAPAISSFRSYRGST